MQSGEASSETPLAYASEPVYVTSSTSADDCKVLLFCGYTIPLCAISQSSFLTALLEMTGDIHAVLPGDITFPEFQDWTEAVLDKQAGLLSSKADGREYDLASYCAVLKLLLAEGGGDWEWAFRFLGRVQVAVVLDDCDLVYWVHSVLMAFINVRGEECPNLIPCADAFVALPSHIQQMVFRAARDIELESTELAAVFRALPASLHSMIASEYIDPLEKKLVLPGTQSALIYMLKGLMSLSNSPPALRTLEETPSFLSPSDSGPYMPMLHALIDALDLHRSLQGLVLVNISLVPQALEMLSPTIARLSQLTSLTLGSRKVPLPPSGLVFLHGIVKCLPKLTSLVLDVDITTSISPGDPRTMESLYMAMIKRNLELPAAMRKWLCSQLSVEANQNEGVRPVSQQNDGSPLSHLIRALSAASSLRTVILNITEDPVEQQQPFVVPEKFPEIACDKHDPSRSAPAPTLPIPLLSISDLTITNSLSARHTPRLLSIVSPPKLTRLVLQDHRATWWLAMGIPSAIFSHLQKCCNLRHLSVSMPACDDQMFGFDDALAAGFTSLSRLESLELALGAQNIAATLPFLVPVASQLTSVYLKVHRDDFFSKLGGEPTASASVGICRAVGQLPVQNLVLSVVKSRRMQRGDSMHRPGDVPGLSAMMLEPTSQPLIASHLTRLCLMGWPGSFHSPADSSALSALTNLQALIIDVGLPEPYKEHPSFAAAIETLPKLTTLRLDLVHKALVGGNGFLERFRGENPEGSYQKLQWLCATSTSFDLLLMVARRAVKMPAIRRLQLGRRFQSVPVGDRVCDKYRGSVEGFAQHLALSGVHVPPIVKLEVRGDAFLGADSGQGITSPTATPDRL